MCYAGYEPSAAAGNLQTAANITHHFTSKKTSVTSLWVTPKWFKPLQTCCCDSNLFFLRYFLVKHRIHGSVSFGVVRPPPWVTLCITYFWSNVTGNSFLKVRSLSHPFTENLLKSLGVLCQTSSFTLELSHDAIFLPLLLLNKKHWPSLGRVSPAVL